jgi:hypothetical protein
MKSKGSNAPSNRSPQQNQCCCTSLGGTENCFCEHGPHYLSFGWFRRNKQQHNNTNTGIATAAIQPKAIKTLLQGAFVAT